MNTNKNIVNLTLILIIASISCLILSLIRINLTGSIRYTFYIWNLFLAWIPYIISFFLYRYYFNHSYKKKKIFLIFGTFFLLIFYPNASYILSDLIHVIRLPIYTYNNSSIITNNSLLWFDILLNIYFAFFGHLIGLFSLLFLHQVLKKMFNIYFSWSLIIFIILLSGYGIYLGRFIRLNSWDIIINPLYTLKMIFSNFFHINAILFSLLFSFFIFITYLIISQSK